MNDRPCLILNLTGFYLQYDHAPTVVTTLSGEQYRLGRREVERLDRIQKCIAIIQYRVLTVR